MTRTKITLCEAFSGGREKQNVIVSLIFDIGEYTAQKTPNFFLKVVAFYLF